MLLDHVVLLRELQRLRGPLFSDGARAYEWFRDHEPPARRFLRRGLESAAFATIDAPVFVIEAMLRHLWRASKSARMEPAWESFRAAAFYQEEVRSDGLSAPAQGELLRHAADFVDALGAEARISSLTSCQASSALRRLASHVRFPEQREPILAG